MSSTPVALNSGDFEVEGAGSAPSSPVELQAGDVDNAPAAQGPVNPYANPAGTPPAQSSTPPPSPAKLQGAIVSAAAPQSMFQRARSYVANSPVGRSLESSAPGLTADLGLTPTESETARMQDEATAGQALEYHPVDAAKQVVAGAKNVAGSVGIGQQAPKGQRLDRAALGATQVMGGAMGVAKPLIVTGIMADPITAAIQYGAGILSGGGAAEVAKRMGATPNEQEFFHVAGFFFPGALASKAGIKTATGQFKYSEVDPATGASTDIPVTGAKVRGPGFAGAVGKDESGGVYAGGRVGKYAIGVRFGGRMPGEEPGVASSETAAPRASGPVAGQLSPETQMGRPTQPSAAEIQTRAQAQTVIETAARAAGIQTQAAQVAGMAPPPPPPPKPGEPGSKEMPPPAGMDKGHLTQQTVSMAAHGIKSLPEEEQAQATLEAVGNLAKWMDGEKTIVGPDNKVVNVDSPKMAQTEAVKIINGEVDRQTEQAEAAAQQQQDLAKQKQEDAETAQQEREESIVPEKPAEKPTEAPVVIPKTPAIDNARTALQAAPDHFTAEKLENVVRNTAMVTTPVRKALVQEEIARRANQQEDTAQEAMTGEPTPEGQSREELQRWADGVKAGEHPYLHVPQGNSFVPAGVEHLKRTPVKGAGAFSGTYYHAPEVSPADIRKAARDKKDPQAALDALTEKFKTSNPVELTADDVEEEAPAKQVQEGKVGDMLGSGETRLTATGRETSPFPKVDTTSKGKATNTVKRVDQWLMDNAIAEAKARGDEFNRRQLEHNRDKPSPVDKDSAEMYLLDNGGNEAEAQKSTPNAQAEEKPAKLVTPLDKFEGEGKSPYEITQKEWTELQRSHRRAIGQDETSGTKAAPYADYEEYHRDSVKTALKFGLPVPEKVLADYPDLKPVILPPEAVHGLSEMVKEANERDPEATLDSVLRSPSTGKDIAEALKNDGIITDSDDLHPVTGVLKAPAREKIGDAMLSEILPPELVASTPDFIKKKLLGASEAIKRIKSKPDEWNLSFAFESAVEQFGKFFRGEETQDAGPVADAIVKALDRSPSELQSTFLMYETGADIARNEPRGRTGGITPASTFNQTFGTELTPEQFAEGMKPAEASVDDIYQPDEAPAEGPSGLKAVKMRNGKWGVIDASGRLMHSGLDKAEAATRAGLPSEATSNQAALAKGDKVSYQTNKGKTRTGEVAWTDGKTVRVKDGESTINKKASDVKLVPAEPSKAEVAGEPSLIDVLQNNPPKNYLDLKRILTEFDKTEPSQLRMKQGQEAFEAAQNRVARVIAGQVQSTALTARQGFEKLLEMYEGQPNLAIRTSTSISNQAYSTPLPLAFIADRFAGINRDGVKVYEPTAGNGALLIAANPRYTLANEMNPERAATLEAEGFSVTRNDATTWAPMLDSRYDAIVANPPFGNLQGPVEIDRYKIVKLDHLIAAKALSVMKDNGKAAIILGAGDRENPGQINNSARPFFNWLYSHYNVVSDFEIAGDLYARQGASFPVRVIAIDGRVRTAKASPLADAIQRVDTWGDVYGKASDVLGSNLEGERRADQGLDSPVRAESAQPSAVSKPAAGLSGKADNRPAEASQGSDGAVGDSGIRTGPVAHLGRVPDPGVGSADITVRSDGDVARSDRLAEGEPAGKSPSRRDAKPDRDTSNALADDANQFQSTYRPASLKKDVSVMAPKALIKPMQAAMDRVSDDVGDIDDWVTKELGYPDTDTMHDAFMGLQVDAIAAAIHNIQQGKAIIVADQTGVGKGRTAAAVIRWAEMHGHIPVFITAGAPLFSDMQRDLHDIGSGSSIVPLLMNSGATITDPVTGKKVLGNTGAMRPVFEKIRATGELPAGRNAVYLSYSQINTPNQQQLVLSRLAPKAVFVLDESHNAAGRESNTGQFLQEVLSASRGVTFLSATWAKRPDNLALYASKTDLSIAIPDKDRIEDALAAGGAPLQAVMTNQLTQAGQHVRRERSFDGIKMENYVDERNQAAHEKAADAVTEVLRGIVAADHLFHEVDFERIQAEMMKAGKGAESRQVVVNHMEFSSIVHNLTKQMLLALKADDSADQIIRAIESGQKPVFALENTMGSFLSSYVEAERLQEGDLLTGLNYSKVLDRALMRTRYYNEKDETGSESKRVDIPLNMLSATVRAEYDKTQALIDKLKVDIPVSSIDHIRMRVEKANHSIAEITGRDWRIDYSGEAAKLAKVPEIEKKDRVNTASQFNNGGLDSLIINQAGSTGISLHASEKFRDQRPRIMMVGQPAGDVNIVMQMLGRINRTGQVALPSYKMLATSLPAEARPAITLAKKMKSLNANVSSNTRSATSVNAVDLMNKYGDHVVAQYLDDNPEMQKQLGLEVLKNNEGGFSEIENLATKATGRSALLPVAEQKQFMDAVSEAYTNYIDYLDETGQNDLEPRTYDFDARETLTRRIYEGTDKTSPFGQDAHYGEYSIKRQGKPFTPEEVQAKIAESFGPEAMQKPPFERDTLAARALAAHIEEIYLPYRETIKSAGSLERADLIRQSGRHLLNEYRVGTGLRIEIKGDTYNAIVTSIDGAKKPSGNPYAPSALQFTLAVNGPLRSVRVPGSQMRAITISNLGRNANVKQLMQDHVGDSRQKAKIVTGNLLGAYGQLKPNSKAQIIAFTMADGTVRQGIHLPDKFDVDQDLSNDYALRTPAGAEEFLKQNGAYLTSTRGEVGFYPSKYDGMEIRTLMSKSSGGKFYLDQKLRELVVGGEFVSQNGVMKAVVKDGMTRDALKVVMDKIALYPTPSEVSRARESDEKANAELAKSQPSKVLRRADPMATMSFMGAGYAAQGFSDIANYAKKAVPATWKELTKFVGASTKSARKIGNEVAAAFAPGAIADEDAKDVMGHAVGEPALRIFQASQFLTGVKKMFEGMPQEDQVEFIDRWQNGKDQPTEDLRQAQEFMQTVLEQQREREMDAANFGRDDDKQIELTQKPNYFPNRYKRAPGDLAPLTEEQQMERIGGMGRQPFEGSKTFLKQQKYTMKEAIEKGAVPLGDPVDILMRRLQEGAKYVAAKYAMQNFKDLGIVTFLRQGQKMPEGYVRINDKIAKVWRPIETAEGGLLFKQTGEWVGQKDAMRMLNNYLSADHIRDSEVGTALVNLKNLSTEMRLSFSPFHWAYITVESMASGLNTGLDQFYNQGVRGSNPAKMAAGLKDIATSIASPYNAVKVGGQMLAYAKDPEGFLATPEGEKFARNYPDFPRLQELLFHGNMRWGMPSGYRMSFGDKFPEAMKNGELGQGFLRAAPWISHVLSKPLFEHYIPRAKWVFAVHMLSQKLAQYSNAIADGTITEEQIAREVAATTDNRFGEFNWDALWLDNTLRTALQVGFRSATWKIGSWRGLTSAAHEQFSSKAFDDGLFDRIDEQAGPFQKAAARLPQLGMNAGWLLSMAVTTAVLGSVLGRLLSGKWPWEWADEAKNGLPKLGNMALEAMHFRTGAMDPHGEPIRGSFPTGLRDYEHGIAAPGKYIKGSLSDVLSNAGDTMINRDFFGNYVYNPNDSLIKEFMQGLSYNLHGDFQPMGISNFERSTGSAGERLGRASGMVGGAPKSMDRSHALNEALDLRAPRAPATPEQKMEWEMQREGPPTRFEIHRALRDKDLGYLEKVVKYQLSYTSAMQVFNDPKTTAAERDLLRPIIARKRVDAIRSGRLKFNGRN